MLTYIPPSEHQAVANAPQSEKPWFLILLCVFWLLPGLIGHDPWKPAENQTVAVVAEMLRGGGWGEPTLAGRPYLEFSPLYYWAAAVLGKTVVWTGLALHDLVRFSTGLWMALALWGIGLAGRELHGHRQGRVAVVLLVGSVGLLQWGHHASPAILGLTAFSWQLYALALARRRPLPAGVLLGLSWLVLLLGATWGEALLAMLCALVLPIFTPWRKSAFFAALLAAFVISLPLGLLWPLYLQQHAPAAFAAWWRSDSLGLYGGFGAPIFFHQAGYLGSIAVWFAFPVLPIAGWAIWGARKHLAESRWQLPLAQLVIVTMWLMLAGSPSDVQALLFLVPLTLLAAGGVDELRRGAASSLFWFGALTFAAIAIVLWACWLAVLLGWPDVLAARLHRLSPAYVPKVGVGVLFAAGVSVAWILVLLGRRPFGRRAATSWACGLTLAWGALVGLWQPWLDASKSYRGVGEGVRGAASGISGCVALMDMGVAPQGGVAYFSGLDVRGPEVAGVQGCPLVLVQASVPDSSRGKLLWQGGRPGESGERFFLYQRQKR